VSNRNGTVRQRILGRRLRRLREEAGHTLEAAAAALEISASRLARIETAQQGADIHVVKSMLDLYDIGGDRWTETLQLVRDARKRAWWEAFSLDENDFYVKYEADAQQVQEFASGFVPGLLQVPGYSLALFEASGVRRTEAERATQIEIRMFRQRRLRDPVNPLELIAIIDERVLRNPVGGVEVLRAQHTHLIESADLPTVTIQVLPDLPGAHAALASGFTVLSFGDLGEPDMAYVEHTLGAAHLTSERDVGMARKHIDTLRTMALRPVDSLALLREIAAAT
jgi:transcriptional regulator with XRE-family HTH domain